MNTLTNQYGKLKLAAIQMCSTSDKERNLEICQKLVRKAASEGAKLVCLPECCLFIGGGLYNSHKVEKSSPQESVNGQSMKIYQELASSTQV
jgi:deaminated glutathione amidase